MGLKLMCNENRGSCVRKETCGPLEQSYKVQSETQMSALAMDFS